MPPESVISKSLPQCTFHSVGFHAWLALLSLQPFNQFGALRQIALAVLLICLTVIGWRSLRLRTQSRHFSIRWWTVGLALVLWCILVSLVGPYPSDSAHALRQGLLVQFLLVVGALVFIRDESDLQCAAAWVIGGFSVLTLLSSIEIGTYWLQHGMALSIPRTHGNWWGGYGSMGACMVPMLVGWVLMPSRTTSQRIFGVLLGAAATALVFLYWSRTPVVVLVIGIAFVLALERKGKQLIHLAAVLTLVVGALSAAPNQQFFVRYKSLLHGDTYISNAGLSLRPSLWKGVVEVIEQRPFLGYGYGWKKMAWAINDGGFAEQWKAEGGDKALYFLNDDGRASYGKVNPHNYFLQVAFEIGVIGLVLALSFWAFLVKSGASRLRGSSPPERTLTSAILALVITYWLSNFTNGQWQGGLANVTLALSASLAVLAERARAKEALVH